MEDKADTPVVDEKSENNAEVKASQNDLAGLLEEMRQDIPEAMRDLIPSLPPIEQMKWIRQAQRKGIFSPPKLESGPDPKRPGGKKPVDMNGLSPAQLLELGLS